MTTALKWLVVVVVSAHGLIHLLGVLKGFGWAQVSQLRQPIGPGIAVVWLLAAVLVLLAAGLIAAGAPTWWWIVAALAAVVSEVAIVTSWGDARFGTTINVLLVLIAGYGFASVGPTSFHAQWRRGAAEALSEEGARSLRPASLTERDLDGLPEPLAAYVRHSGAVGKPHVTNVSARFHGRIRSGPGQDWMPFTGEQVNTFGVRPRRIFLMDATRAGVPVTVLHSFKDRTASMKVKLLSMFTLVDAAGPEMDRGETVTLFNDLVVLAPAAIVDAPVTWTPVDDHHVRGEYTDGNQTVSAELVFDVDHDLVDFVSDDRLRASVDGTSFARQEWSTPLTQHRHLGGRQIPVTGLGRWRAPEPEGQFTYVELHFDEISYNVDRTERVPWVTSLARRRQ